MKHILHIVFILLVSSNCFTQQQYTFTKYTEPHGLTTSSMWQMFKDTTGYLWIYGEPGIARFDGYNSKLFRHNPDDSNRILDYPMSNAFLLPDGNIYIETWEEVRLYDPQKLAFNKPFPYKIHRGLKNYCYSLKNDNNALYFFTDENLTRLSNAEFNSFPLPERWEYGTSSASSDSSSNIMLNISGNVYIFKSNDKRFTKINLYDRFGKSDTTVFSVVYSALEKNFIAISTKHLYSYDKNTDRFIPGLDLHQNGSVKQMSEFNIPLLYQKYYFAFTTDGKLYKLNIETGEEIIIQLNKKIPEHEIKFLNIDGVVDKHGVLWIYSNCMGLFRYEILSDRFEQFIHEPGKEGSIPTNNINAIIPDDEGMAWIGCGVEGLVKMEPVVRVMERLSPAENKKKIVFTNDAINVRSFLETESGYLVGALNGFYNYDATKKEFSEVTGLLRQEPSNVSALARDESGNTWSGTWGGWISIEHPKNNKRISFDKKAGEKEVRDMFCDSKNTMWIATGVGKIFTVNVNEIDFDNPALLKFKPVEYNLNNDSGISNIVFTITEDAEGNMWAGGNKGLYCLKSGEEKWIHYSNIPGDEHSIHGNDVRALEFDKNGNLWIGTNGGGLNRYNKATNNFTHFTTENGLPNDAVYTVLCDNNGMLWLGTNYGLCRFNPDNYSCKNFTLKDGLQNYEFNTNAALKLKDGRLLFGGVDGYNVIDPSKIDNSESLPPTVVISSIKNFDRELLPGDGHLQLTYNENTLTFEFAALSFYLNQDNRYAYKMQGIDPDWIYSNDRRFVTYSNLEPGTYIFKVKACNSNGVWNEEGTQITITITPPWWKTWWFSSGVVLFIILLVLWLFRRNTAALRKNKLILEKTVNQRTADLRTQKEIAEQQKTRAELSEKAKHQFLANMSHEIRTPMNAIKGMTDILIRRNPNDDQKEYLTGIKQSSDSLLVIINDILDISKIDAGKVELEHEPFSINELVNNVYTIMQFKAEEKGLFLQKSIPNENLVVQGDATRLRQILLNLIGNAIKFTEKGLITTTVKSEQVGENLNLHFIISDTGIGIEKDRMEKIFESFEQAYNDTTRKYGGTGLGLSISKKLVELHNGKIWVESEKGKGSQFHFVIPYTQVKTTVEATQDVIDFTDVPKQLKCLHILLVEDNHYNAIVAQEELEDAIEDVRIDIAANGIIAVEKLKSNTFDVILMDIQMPVMNGFDATKAIRKMEGEKSKTPIIAMTANVLKEEVDLCYASGMNDFIGKPFDIDELLTKIQNLIKK